MAIKHPGYSTGTPVPGVYLANLTQRLGDDWTISKSSASAATHANLHVSIEWKDQRWTVYAAWYGPYGIGPAVMAHVRWAVGLGLSNYILAGAEMRFYDGNLWSDWDDNFPHNPVPDILVDRIQEVW